MDKMIISRRGIIGGLLAAPAIIKLAPLMKIRPAPLLTMEQVRQEYEHLLDDGLVEDFPAARFMAMAFVRSVRPIIQSTFPRELL